MSADPGLHPETRAEFIAEVDHLNGERPGLGDDFEQALYATADMIGLWPLSAAHGTRAGLLGAPCEVGVGVGVMLNR